MNMSNEMGSKQECEARMRKARFWASLGHKAMLSFGALVCLMILSLAIVGLLPIFGKSVSSGLFYNFIFILVSLLILSSLVTMISNFLKSLYHGTPGCSCGALGTNCSECGFQQPTRLSSEKE
jgi:hypothetical protein